MNTAIVCFFCIVGLQQTARFDDPTTFHWIPNTYLSGKVRNLPLSGIERVFLSGEDVGCFYPNENIVITDPMIIRLLKTGLEQAMQPDQGFGLPGRATANSITFLYKPFYAAKAKAKYLRYYFEPCFQATCAGPHFQKALKVYSIWYAERIKHSLPHSVSSITSLELDYENDRSTELDVSHDRKAIRELLKAVPTIATDVYDVTEKDRYVVRLHLVRKDGKDQTFHLLIPVDRTKARSRFAQIIYKYMDAEKT